MAFVRALEELLDINIVQGLGVLFFFGPGLAQQPQKSLEPAGYCASRLLDHYQLVVTLSYFLVFSVLLSICISRYVKYRVPAAADGGLQSVDARKKKLLRLYALVGLATNVAASALAMATYAYLLQAKTKLLECQPAPVRAAVYATNVLVAATMGCIYYADAKVLMFATT